MLIANFAGLAGILLHPSSDHLGTGCQGGKSLYFFATVAKNAGRRELDAATALASPRLRLLNFAKRDERHLNGKTVPSRIDVNYVTTWSELRTDVKSRRQWEVPGLAA